MLIIIFLKGYKNASLDNLRRCFSKNSLNLPPENCLDFGGCLVHFSHVLQFFLEGFRGGTPSLETPSLCSKFTMKSQNYDLCFLQRFNYKEKIYMPVDL